jgi:hypothetical protein
MYSLNGINIRLMASESLRGTTTPNIPKLGSGIASTGDKHILLLVWP